MKQLTCVLACCCILAASLEAQPPRRKTVYENKNFQFCISVPSGWEGGEPFTQNGIVLAPRSSKLYFRPPQMTIGARVNQPSEQNEQRPQTLKENIDSIIQSLQQYGAAENLQIIKETDATVQGVPARSITLRYRDASSGDDWVVKDLNFIDRGNVVYFVELRFHPRDLDALTSIWEAVVQSLRIHCGGTKSTKSGRVPSQRLAGCPTFAAAVAAKVGISPPLRGLCS